MSEIGDKICEQVSQKEIDWEWIEGYVSGLGEKINAYDEKWNESILSELYLSHGHPGSVNLRLTEMFLKYGFDVKANEGKNGASCLCALCWSSYDRYVLHVAELLFDAGAGERERYAEEADDDGVLSDIKWKLGYWYTGEYDSANMFVAYYFLADRALAGKEYSGIRAFRDCVGKTVSQVERIKEKSLQGDQWRYSYLLRCEDMDLVARDYIEFIINPYARETAVEIEDVSDEYREIIGAKVQGLRYFNSSLAKLNFDNGYAMQIGDARCGYDAKTWFRVTSSGKGKLPTAGTAIESIKLWGKIRHSEISTYYCENTIVLSTEKCAYGLYAKGNGYKDASIRVERLDKELLVDIERKIEENNLVLKHVEYHGDAIKWVSCSCEDGIIYIVPEGGTEVAIFMSEFEIQPNEIRDINSCTKGLKKIRGINA